MLVRLGNTTDSQIGIIHRQLVNVRESLEQTLPINNVLFPIVYQRYTYSALLLFKMITKSRASHVRSSTYKLSGMKKALHVCEKFK